MKSLLYCLWHGHSPVARTIHWTNEALHFKCKTCGRQVKESHVDDPHGIMAAIIWAAIVAAALVRILCGQPH